MSNVPNVNQTVTPYTKVPDINQSSTFEGDTSTFLSELNSRLVEGNIQIGQINDMVNAVNLLPDLAGGYSQSHIDNTFATILDTYTKTDADNTFATILDTYTKTEVDDELFTKVPKTAQVILWESLNGAIGENGVNIGGGETLYPSGDVYGVNGNGTYLKGANGTLACYAYQLSVSIDVNGGGVLQMPTPSIIPFSFSVVGNNANNNAVASMRSITPHGFVNNLTHLGFFVKDGTNNNVVSVSENFTYIAEGRWK